MPNTKVVEAKKEQLAAPVTAPRLAISAEDIEIPRLNVIQGSSEIDGDEGALVINRTHTIMPTAGTLSVIPITASKGWAENVPFGSNDIARIAYSLEEKTAIDADSEFGTIEFADITLLIPEPKDIGEDAADAFPFPIGETSYAMGKIHVRKAAYRNTYKRLGLFQAMNPESPLCAKHWKFQADQATANRVSWYIPQMTVTKEDTDEQVVEFVSRIIPA
tara:strand:+ start:4759 stop:5415 length:657 start_codon:yes stop_codon:yes gene_type:complete